jgi:circadian clock protein KaiB
VKKLQKFRFVLYVAAETQNSLLAATNLNALCREHLPGLHEIEIVDVFKKPERALADRIFMTPLLIRTAPSPPQRVIGTLSQPERLLQALGLRPAAQ